MDALVICPAAGAGQSMARPWAAITLAFLVLNCGGQSPASPTSVSSVATSTGSPTLPTSGPFRIISGSVSELTAQGAGPLSGAAINAWIDQGSFGYSYWWANGPVHSATGGTFELRIPEGGSLWLQAFKEGYVQPCAAQPLKSAGNGTLDLTLVPRAYASAVVSALATRTLGRVVSGRVVDTAGKPMSGVFVDFEPVMDFPAATGYTDADGRYTLCGLPDTQAVFIGAGLGSRVAYVTVAAGQTNIEIVLPDT